MALSDRLTKIERAVASRRPKPRRWTRIVWEAGERWRDALGHSDYRAGDNVILRRVVEAKDGQPVPDAIHSRDAKAVGAFMDGAGR